MSEEEDYFSNSAFFEDEIIRILSKAFFETK